MDINTTKAYNPSRVRSIVVESTPGLLVSLAIAGPKVVTLVLTPDEAERLCDAIKASQAESAAHQGKIAGWAERNGQRLVLPTPKKED